MAGKVHRGVIFNRRVMKRCKVSVLYMVKNPANFTQSLPMNNHESRLTVRIGNYTKSFHSPLDTPLTQLVEVGLLSIKFETLTEFKDGNTRDLY